MNPLARAPWWATVLAALGIALGVTAGAWQLGRAAEKRDLFAAFETGGAVDPIRTVPRSVAGARYRRVELRGRYDPGRQVLLDNLSHAGRAGYQVLTPFMTDEGPVMVNRGWIPSAGDRRQLPDLGVAPDLRTIRARIDRLPVPALRLDAGAPPAGAPWPRRLLFPTAAVLASQTGYALPDLQLLLDPESPDGFLREWRPALMSPERHVAYAVQWFALALTVVVIYLVLTRRRTG